MQSRRVQIVSLALVTLLAAGLRIYDVGDHPAGFYCDEAGLGYNAYTIANAGTDENGNRFPLFFWSFGVSYKNPAFIYAAAIPVKLFGNTEFAVRLTSALFGTGTVIGLFFVGRTLMGPWLGLFAAFFLAIVPWHLHFSRIAFELISFPFFFVWGLHFFIGFLKGRSTLPAAMFFFGLCFYAYAIANLFVPLFVIGATLLFLPTFLRRWGQSAIALVVLAATIAPIGNFYYERFGSTGSQYFRNTTHLQPDAPLGPQIERTWLHYQRFFSPEFLFERGDPIVRHAVPGFGELYPAFLPLLLLGIVVALAYPNRATKLIVWWLALYPLGASLMTEIPSATRAIIGVPAFCLLTAIGAVAILRALGWIGRWRPLALTLQSAAIGAGLYFLAPEVDAYLRAYFLDYPAQSAPGYGGFQYGYRESIQYMESRRDEYDVLMLTAVEVNQPQVFPQFYRGVAPGQPNGYLILNPAEFGRYSTDRRILAQVRPTDLDLFDDFEVHREIVAPDGHTEFVIAELRSRKNFVSQWLVLGLFENDSGTGIDRDHIDPADLRRDGYPGAFGPAYWRRISPQFVLVDLNQFFVRADPRHPGNPEHACAYAVVTVQSDTPQSAQLEISGTDDVARIWLNGRSLTPYPLRLGTPIQRRPIDLLAGNNQLLIKSCENVGGWAFRARLTDLEGKDLQGIRAIPEIHDTPPSAPSAYAADVQVVEGFGEVLEFGLRHERHEDYRGGTESWWVFVHDQQGEVSWRTAAPPAAQSTVFAFAGTRSHERGQMELYVDGKYALRFDLGPDEGIQRWQRGPYELAFVSKQQIAGNSGIFLLRVPAEDVRAGIPVELRVQPAGGTPEAWFALKDYRDTIPHEGLTGELAAETLRAPWNEPIAPEPEPDPGVEARAHARQQAQVEADAVEPSAETAASAPRTDVAAEAAAEGDGAAGAVLLRGAEARDDGSYWIPDGAAVRFPNRGTAVGQRGAIAFWIEPAWNGSEDSTRSFVQIRDPQRWENRIQIFKNGRYLRFLFTDESGTESGVGTELVEWSAGTRHHIVATWVDGLTYLYVDGALVGTNPFPARIANPAATPLWLGADHPGGMDSANAAIGGFEMLDREMSADEVRARLVR